ncbi:PhzF family phenazine biosynthesis protein [Oceaniglobus ichthyenteri]|uniref:PhzF family phenazine biosynthesis protein n=1 Tax=Oceaniglobus ichthyenteri TaxID=2136177 RepID=UPI000D384B74|nr:PhzF family phenazine biosynthesis protein [Oceaniglobus ichthyenteri]
MKRRFIQADVFSDQATRGNGLAVIVDADGLSDQQMQHFAAWTNLAETTFILPPTDPAADYRVRIFTPGREMPFAGHPTLGSCAAWLHTGGAPKTPGRVMQECQIGLVEIDQTGPTPAFVAPPTAISDMPRAQRDGLATALKLARGDILRAAILDNGPVWQVLELSSAEAALAVDETLVRWPEHVAVAVMGAHSSGDCAYEVRNISPSSGMSEDPVTGSLCSAVAKWLDHQGRLGDGFIFAQGTKLGRLGRISVRRRGADILIGGHTTVVIDGTVNL